MSCVLDSLKHLFKINNVKWPRTETFSNISYAFKEDRFKNAMEQAQTVCFVLNYLHNRSIYIRYPSKNVIAFINPNSKGRGIHSSAHALAIFRYSDFHKPAMIDRYCAYECNVRKVIDSVTAFKFTTKDWITSQNPKYLDKPFQFSYVITESGFSLWINPRKVIHRIQRMKPFDHKFKFDKTWGEKYKNSYRFDLGIW